MLGNCLVEQNQSSESINWSISKNGHRWILKTFSYFTCVPVRSSRSSNSILMGSWGGRPIGYTMVTAPRSWSRASFTISIVTQTLALTCFWRVKTFIHIEKNIFFPILSSSKKNKTDIGDQGLRLLHCLHQHFLHFVIWSCKEKHTNDKNLILFIYFTNVSC